jgi:hypothetical protein
MIVHWRTRRNGTEWTVEEEDGFFWANANGASRVGPFNSRDEARGWILGEGQ